MMTVELLSGRLVAPYLGNSLYTWTAVLTSVLVGIAIGSYAGGKLTERSNLFSKLSTWLALSAAALAIVVFAVIPAIGPYLQDKDWPLSALSLLFALAVFLPLAFALAVTTPLLVKDAVHELRESGAKYGTLAAWNAGGSILGTYVTGFLFIGYLNTFHVILAVIVLLGILSSMEFMMTGTGKK
jgi:MFS family permease